jgi:hypothetical protein
LRTVRLTDQEKVRGTGLKMLSCSKMLCRSKWSNIDMAGEKQKDQSTLPEREQARDLRSPAPPSPQPGPPILNDGLELPRSSHC